MCPLGYHNTGYAAIRKLGHTMYHTHCWYSKAKECSNWNEQKSKMVDCGSRYTNSAREVERRTSRIV